MNAKEIFDKYTEALMDLGLSEDTSISADAILLALRLAIGDTYAAARSTPATITDRLAEANRAQLDRLNEWLAANEVALYHNPDLDTAAAMIQACKNLTEQMDTFRVEALEMSRELAGLRQQLAQMDADNATLTRKLAVANSHIAALTDRIHTSESNIHTNGNGAAPEVTSAEIIAQRTFRQLASELADYWESLDKGRRTFRQLEKRIRLDLAQAALASFAELPTQVAFDAAKPEWMPTATTLCTTFGCKWTDLPALKWEQVKQ